MKCSPCLPKLINQHINLIEYGDAHPNSVIGLNLYYEAIGKALSDANEAITIRNGTAVCMRHLLRAVGLNKG